MKDTSIGQKETSVVERPWPPEQGEWADADWLKPPDDGYFYEVIDGVLYISPSIRQRNILRRHHLQPAPQRRKGA